jgi:hypothetical protein
MTEVFRGFPQSLQANTRIIPEFGHDRFPPNPFKFIFHQSSRHSMLDYNLDTSTEPSNKTEKKNRNVTASQQALQVSIRISSYEFSSVNLCLPLNTCVLKHWDFCAAIFLRPLLARFSVLQTEFKDFLSCYNIHDTTEEYKTNRRRNIARTFHVWLTMITLTWKWNQLFFGRLLLVADYTS